LDGLVVPDAKAVQAEALEAADAMAVPAEELVVPGGSAVQAEALAVPDALAVQAEALAVPDALAVQAEALAVPDALAAEAAALEVADAMAVQAEALAVPDESAVPDALAAEAAALEVADESAVPDALAAEAAALEVVDALVVPDALAAEAAALEVADESEAAETSVASAALAVVPAESAALAALAVVPAESAALAASAVVPAESAALAASAVVPAESAALAALAVVPAESAALAALAVVPAVPDESVEPDASAEVADPVDLAVQDASAEADESEGVGVEASAPCSARRNGHRGKRYLEGKLLHPAPELAVVELAVVELAVVADLRPKYSGRDHYCTPFRVGSRLAPEPGSGADEARDLDAGCSRRSVRKPDHSVRRTNSRLGGFGKPKRNGRYPNRSECRRGNHSADEYRGIRRTADRKLRRTRSARRLAYSCRAKDCNRSLGNKHRSRVHNDPSKNRSVRSTNTFVDRPGRNRERSSRTVRRSYKCTADERNVVRNCRTSSSTGTVRRTKVRTSRGKDRNNIRKSKPQSVVALDTGHIDSPSARSRCLLDNRYRRSRRRSTRVRNRNNIRLGKPELLPASES
jgi:hypothetical protein